MLWKNRRVLYKVLWLRNGILAIVVSKFSPMPPMFSNEWMCHCGLRRETESVDLGVTAQGLVSTPTYWQRWNLLKMGINTTFPSLRAGTSVFSNIGTFSGGQISADGGLTSHPLLQYEAISTLQGYMGVWGWVSEFWKFHKAIITNI